MDESQLAQLAEQTPGLGRESEDKTLAPELTAARAPKPSCWQSLLQPQLVQAHPADSLRCSPLALVGTQPGSRSALPASSSP